MHEKGIIDSLIHKILDLAEKEGAVKVSKVSVKLGALSHMSASHFKEHFDAAAKGTIAENAALETEESDSLDDPYAQQVLLKSIDVD